MSAIIYIPFYGIGGSYERKLRKNKDIALEEMQEEGRRFGANTMITVDLDYKTIGSLGGNMLMIRASVTSVLTE